MKENLTDITIVLDRSGSMQSIREDTMGGVNRFVQDQAATPGECHISLVQFDDRYEPNYTAINAQNVTALTTETYEPRGSTALLDAIGKTIAATGARLRSMPEAERPGKVVFVIVTDGHENASAQYNAKQVNELVQHQTDIYKWQFIYLGAGIDAIMDASKTGFQYGNTMNVAKNPAGVRAAFAATSGKMFSYRMSGNAANLSYSAEERLAQASLGAQPESTSTTTEDDSNSTAAP